MRCPSLGSRRAYRHCCPAVLTILPWDAVAVGLSRCVVKAQEFPPVLAGHSPGVSLQRYEYERFVCAVGCPIVDWLATDHSNVAHRAAQEAREANRRQAEWRNQDLIRCVTGAPRTTPAHLPASLSCRATLLLTRLCCRDVLRLNQEHHLLAANAHVMDKSEEHRKMRHAGATPRSPRQSCSEGAKGSSRPAPGWAAVQKRDAKLLTLYTPTPLAQGAARAAGGVRDADAD